MNLPLEETYDFAWKHFPPWFLYPKHPESDYPEEFYTFEGGEKTLFIVVFRNAYDWVRSFHLQPHHAYSTHTGLSLNQFVRKEWEVEEGAGQGSSFIDRNPIDNQPFANVLRMRSAKIENMLLMKGIVDNIYYVNYEALREHPEEVIQEICQVFHLAQNQPFQKVASYKREGSEKYRKTRYSKIHYRTLQFINSQLDWELEESIGYQRIDDPKQTR